MNMANDDLLGFVSAVSGDAYLKVEETLGDGYVRLRVSEAERRQAKHDIRSVEDVVIELLRNARDAYADRIFLATAREGDKRVLTFVDDGVGIPAAMQEKIFEPRVTSKLETMVMDQWGVHGRGMALYSIKSNVIEARVAASDLHKGASLSVVADAAKLGERADQSSWPIVERDLAGLPKITRGPHNIVRRVVEFSLEHPGIEVYLGSPAEILATLHGLTRDRVDASELLFCDDLTRLPVWQRPGGASDAEDLAQVAEQIALGVSERTAHRILAGELPSLGTVLSQALAASAPAVSGAADIYRDRRGLKIDHGDMAQFRAELEAAFDTIAERYYLHLKCEPKITVGKDDIRVRFEVEKED